MTAKAALAQALLDGKVLNVKNVFNTIGLTNCAREISRMIEKPFSVHVSRVQREGKSKYGSPVVWVDYRLNKIPSNLEGIERMKAYIQEQLSGQKPTPEKPTKEIIKSTTQRTDLFGNLI